MWARPLRVLPMAGQRRGAMGMMDQAQSQSRSAKASFPSKFTILSSDVEDQAAVITAVSLTPQSSPDHLEVQVGAIHRTGDDDRAGLRCIEALPEYSIVHKRLNLAGPERLNNAAAGGWISLSTHGPRPDTLCG